MWARRSPLPLVLVYIGFRMIRYAHLRGRRSEADRSGRAFRALTGEPQEDAVEEQAAAERDQRCAEEDVATRSTCAPGAPNKDGGNNHVDDQRKDERDRRSHIQHGTSLHRPPRRHASHPHVSPIHQGHTQAWRWDARASPTAGSVGGRAFWAAIENETGRFLVWFHFRRARWRAGAQLRLVSSAWERAMAPRARSS